MNTITTDKVLVGGVEIRITRDGKGVTLEEAVQALGQAQSSINRTLGGLRGGKAEDAPHVTPDVLRAFKAGDVVTFEHVDARCVTAIFNTYNENDACIGFYCAIAQDETLTVHVAYEHLVDIDKIRLATEDERRRLTDALRDDRCLMWDETERKLVRWRAERGEYYFAIRYIGGRDNIDAHIEDMSRCCDHRYEYGNYYPTREMAERREERIRAILKTPHTDEQDA
ncbi:MAG: hypothetical protein Q4A64_08835 [Porphyromonadaceae bacterium]|nr:hypothetical protein [Porphyromonadaceae bacterium]